MFASQLSSIPYSFTAHGSEEFEKAPLLSLDEKLEPINLRRVFSSSWFGKSQLDALVFTRSVEEELKLFTAAWTPVFLKPRNEREHKIPGLCA